MAAIKLHHQDDAADVEPVADGDPFDLTAFRADPAVATAAGTVLQIGLGRPERQSFFRVRPGAEWRMVAHLIEDKDDRRDYLVHPSVAQQYAEETVLRELRLVRTIAGGLLIWPVKMPSGDGPVNSWVQSAREAADLAEKEWIRLISSTPQQRYLIKRAMGEMPEPVWPTEPFSEIVRQAFGANGIVTAADHLAIRKLEGRVG